MAEHKAPSDWKQQLEKATIAAASAKSTLHQATARARMAEEKVHQLETQNGTLAACLKQCQQEIESLMVRVAKLTSDNRTLKAKLKKRRRPSVVSS
jgi:predicted RNase H-like nuclease (RuvC/YqgF family)